MLLRQSGRLKHGADSDFTMWNHCAYNLSTKKHCNMSHCTNCSRRCLCLGGISVLLCVGRVCSVPRSYLHYRRCRQSVPLCHPTYCSPHLCLDRCRVYRKVDDVGETSNVAFGANLRFDVVYTSSGEGPACGGRQFSLSYPLWRNAEYGPIRALQMAQWSTKQLQFRRLEARVSTTHEAVEQRRLPQITLVRKQSGGQVLR